MIFAERQFLLPDGLRYRGRHVFIRQAGENVIVLAVGHKFQDIQKVNLDIVAVKLFLHYFIEILLDFNQVKMILGAQLFYNFFGEGAGAGTQFQDI